ncbi:MULTISPECIES: hypothetical protein [Paenibacillus]|uniref:Uncharacterized protein n=1 Tax=Paenibacillus borealis TaxID=160799 RepID=A0ABX3H651_PAEBO|nr:hypothetical protein [Paenibacillus borealis]OMD45917.1 hypothetical protein BSK56_18295 [Paenibacillus borealis]
MMTFLAVILGLVSLLVFMLIIRKAIDDSKTSHKLDILIQEIRLLRKEIKENKHIIDKRL